MRISVIGLGIMGQAMTLRLLAAGHTVTLYNRTKSKAKPFLDEGAHWADTPGEAARNADVVFSIVTDPSAVAAITEGDQGILKAIPAAAVHCDMSTVTPQSAQALQDAYRAQGKRFVQAPVLGSKKQIEAGTLLVFGGGAAEDVQQCETAWRAFSSKSWHLGDAAQAATAKLACNMLIAQMILGLGQSLVFAAKGGVAPSVLLEILGESALASPMYASKGKTLLDRQFQANFVVRNMLKDLRLASEAGEQSATPLPMNGLARELFVSAVQHGWGDEDYSAVVKTLELLAGTELGNS